MEPNILARYLVLECGAATLTRGEEEALCSSSSRQRPIDLAPDRLFASELRRALTSAGLSSRVSLRCLARLPAAGGGAGEHVRHHDDFKLARLCALGFSGPAAA